MCFIYVFARVGDCPSFLWFHPVRKGKLLPLLHQFEDKRFVCNWESFVLGTRTGLSYCVNGVLFDPCSSSFGPLFKEMCVDGT